MSNELRVRGICASSGRRFVRVELGDKIGSAPLDAFTLQATRAIEMLSRQDVILIGPASRQELIKQVEALKDFPQEDVAEHVGWNGGSFALPDGSVISPRRSPKPIIAFETVADKCSVTGSLREWKKQVAEPLDGQSIGIFALCFAFVAPLLSLTSRQGNFGFELVGVKGAGKSTIQYIASSVLGGFSEGSNDRYWLSLNSTINALDDTMVAHADMPIILDEAGLFAAGDSPRVRGEAYKALAFKLASGDRKSRLGEPKRKASRHVFLISANESLIDLTDRHSDSASAAADRLMTICVPDRQYGVFDHLPAGHSGSREYAQALTNAAEQHHGQAFRKFLKRLERPAENLNRGIPRSHDV